MRRVFRRFGALVCLCAVISLLSVGCVPSDPTEHSFTLSPEDIRAAGTLVLVNSHSLWPADYEPENLISLMENRPKGLVGLRDGSLMADAEAFEALVDMLEAAKEAGHSGYTVLSAYRSTEKQEELYRKEQASFLKKLLGSAARTAAPGASEHHTGLAFDLGIMHDGNLIDGFGSTPEGQWVNAYCTEFGFVQRYAAGKEAITGIVDEPWHYRYVGIDAAQAMVQSGLCLEEYLEQP